MYLKKVEIQGFKSFAEKTEVEFNSRVTAIVGPNGSGKSNIADAIRWVLGEQSVKNLRGTRMEDIIFSGTEKRKALGFSEVTIIFDNESGIIPIDYREVAVTRRMFRSGESEYYINKNSCRLKDIREMFMDTGVGKEGYSIIGQGKIDEILSNKPEDRRNIFEEAAGIVKYKSRKQEALRKLERTQSNLTRISDLLHEIKGQKDNLHKEAEKAREFQKLYGQLRKLDTGVSVYEVNRLKEKLNEIQIKKESSLSVKEALDNEVSSIDQSYSLKKENISLLEKTIEDRRTLKMESIQEFEKSKNRVGILGERETFLKRESHRLEEDISKSRELLLNGDNSVDVTELEIEKLVGQYKELERELAEKQNHRQESSASLNELDLTIQSNKRSVMELYSCISDNKSENQTIESFKNSINGRIELLSEDKDRMGYKLAQMENEFDSILTDLKDKKTLKEKMVADNKSLQDREMIIKDKINSISNEVQRLSSQLENANSSYKLYSSMEREYEGYYNSVKSVVKAAKSDHRLGSGFIGTVAELFTVERKLLKAIEIAMGSSLQNIVVKDDASARAMIDYLKKNKSGRATFLPLTTVTGKELTVAQKDKDQYRILGAASSLVQTESVYNDVFLNLLGRTLIAETVEDALAYSKKYGFRTRMVTLDGEVINPGGSLSGGSSNNQSISILNRKQTLSELSSEIKNLEKRLTASQMELGKLKDGLESIILKSQSISAEITSLSENVSLLEKAYSNTEYQIQVQKRSMDSKETEIKSLQEELLELDFSQKKILIKQEILIEDHKALEAATETLQLTYESQKAEKEALDNEVTELRIRTNSVEKTLANYREKAVESKNSISLARDNLELMEKELLKIKSELEGIGIEKETLQEYIESQAKKEDEESRLLKEKVNEKDKLMKEFYQLQDNLRDLTKRQNQAERELDKLDVDQAKYHLQIDNIIEKLENDYEMTFEEAEKTYTAIEDVRGSKRLVGELKQGIKELGNVNISSIEEYDSILERYEFLNNQLVDLHGAKEDIESVVKDMERKMRIQFKKSFHEINERFIETFSVLFNGGKARLEIDDEDDILTAGIEIMAQPPGKKLQSLTLLSGGEKSLTAVALLFAILKTRPSPFCILDEIDAALDEANISRYTSYLNGLEDNTQFVLITHRKTTMEIADILYGVTMEEEGVSRMISLKLKDYDDIAS